MQRTLLAHHPASHNVVAAKSSEVDLDQTANIFSRFLLSLESNLANQDGKRAQFLHLWLIVLDTLTEELEQQRLRSTHTHFCWLILRQLSRAALARNLIHTLCTIVISGPSPDQLCQTSPGLAEWRHRKSHFPSKEAAIVESSATLC